MTAGGVRLAQLFATLAALAIAREREQLRVALHGVGDGCAQHAILEG